MRTMAEPTTIKWRKCERIRYGQFPMTGEIEINIIFQKAISTIERISDETGNGATCQRRFNSALKSEMEFPQKTDMFSRLLKKTKYLSQFLHSSVCAFKSDCITRNWQNGAMLLSMHVMCITIKLLKCAPAIFVRRYASLIFFCFRI